MSQSTRIISLRLASIVFFVIIFSTCFLFSETVLSQDTEAFPPLVYNLLGGTSRVSGGLVDVESDDDNYMSFASYPSIGVSDSVDSNTSDVDSSINVGTHSNFSAQTEGPDSMIDTLTEENTGGGNRTLIYAESFEGTWPPLDWSETDNWFQESSYVHDGSYSADFDGSFFGSSGYLTSPSMDCSDAYAIYVDFWWYDDDLGDDDFELEYYNGSVWNNHQDLNQRDSGNGWHYYNENLTDSQYFVSNFQIRWWAKSLGYGETGCVDLVTVKKQIPGNANYRLELEVQWTNTLYNVSNTDLCVFAGAMGSEDVSIEVWNDTLWEILLIDLAGGWNNVSVSQYLDSPLFTIRFKGSLETGDTFQDSWNIDVVLLHAWSDDRLVEVEFSGSSRSGEIAQVIWTLDSCWTSSLVNVTLQLYNYSLDDYSSKGDGYFNYISSPTPEEDETRKKTITINPLHYRNVSGYWKIKIKGSKTLDEDFELKADLVRYEISSVISPDVAVLSVTMSILKVHVGETVTINVTVANRGETIETFNVAIYNNNTRIAVQTVSDLTPSSSKTLVFNWDTTNVSKGVYTIRATADTLTGELNLEDNNFVSGLLEIDDPAPWQPFSAIELVLSALVVLGILIPFSIKLRQRKKTENTPAFNLGFDEQFGMTNQEVAGRKILLEVDPTSGYHSALLGFVSEAMINQEALFIFTGRNSALHTALSGENVKFFLLISQISSRKQISNKEIQIPASDLSVLLDTFSKIPQIGKSATILFDNLSDTILMCGYEKTYKFLRFLLEALSPPSVTALFVFNPTAHSSSVSSSIRGLFRYQLTDLRVKSSSAQS